MGPVRRVRTGGAEKRRVVGATRDWDLGRDVGGFGPTVAPRATTDWERWRWSVGFASAAILAFVTFGRSGFLCSAG